MSSVLVGRSKKAGAGKSKSRGSKTGSRKKKKDKNVLKMIPVKNYEWTKQKKNKDLIRILKPRFDTKLGGSVGKKLKLTPTYNINLDEYGTAVWRLCDGKLTVIEIGEILQTEFGDDVEPLYPRLAAFLRILDVNGAIVLKPKRVKKKRKTI